jgi:hypothetical protein
MFSQLLKMSKEKTVRVKFKIVDGKIHMKNLNVSPKEYERIAEKIHSIIDRDVLKNHNFNASINITI